MQTTLLDVLRCPQSGQQLELQGAEYVEGRVRNGLLISLDGKHRYPIREFVPRFVPRSNYADNFGMQWNKFRTTQLDSCSGHPISAERFWKATGWGPSLDGEWVLDAGCGAGRFAEVALHAGAQVFALDYSSAVDACYANLGPHPRLHVVQGDIYALPFPKRLFRRVYSLGVLQHTPDVCRAFDALTQMVAPQGKLCVDFYERSIGALLHPKYLLRPLTTRLAQDRLFSMLETAVPMLLKASQAAGQVPLMGSALKRLVPVANYIGVLPLSERQHLEWSLLDTYDWLAPRFDNPQTASTLRDWFAKAGFADIEVGKAGHLVGRGTAPHASGY